MNQWVAYWELGRFNKPIGTALLWYPTACALWFANKGFPPISFLVLFFFGTVVMRAAGCVINDMADRNVDRYVARTHQRPITAGIIQLVQAFIFLAVLLFFALIILLMLPRACVPWAFASLAITCIYPFCKRFLRAPQFVLGFAFSMGIPMAYAASHAPMDGQFVLLLLMNFLWIVAYDTMYAMADRDDDLRIGVKSTAIYFANYDRLIIGLMQILLHGLWWMWGTIYHVGIGFFIAWGLATFVILYQQMLIRNRMPDDCLHAFRISTYYGLLMWMGVILGFATSH